MAPFAGLMRSTSPDSVDEFSIWNVSQPGPDRCRVLPQPPFDTETRFAGGAPPLQAASTPAATARAAVIAARRTSGTHQVRLSDRIGQRKDKHASLRPSPRRSHPD